MIEYVCDKRRNKETQSREPGEQPPRQESPSCLRIIHHLKSKTSNIDIATVVERRVQGPAQLSAIDKATKHWNSKQWDLSRPDIP